MPDVEKIIESFHKIGVARTAKELGMSYKDVRLLLIQNGIKIARGRKRGSGLGMVSGGNGYVDRRVKWQTEQIEAGRCTNCGEPNDSDSMYHCKKCLKKRNEQKQEKMENK